MIFRLGNITLDIDIEKTAEFHAGLQTAAESCGCVGCRNYDMACSSFPEVFMYLFVYDVNSSLRIMHVHVHAHAHALLPFWSSSGIRSGAAGRRSGLL